MAKRRRKAPGEPKEKRGRKQHKGQISVRIEQSYLDLAYKHAEATGERITDVLERAVMKLVIEEMNENPMARRARFLVLYTTPEEQDIVTRLLPYWRIAPERISAFEETDRKAFLAKLERVAEMPEHEEARKTFGKKASESSATETVQEPR